jgi:hypothetical protein
MRVWLALLLPEQKRKPATSRAIAGSYGGQQGYGANITRPRPAAGAYAIIATSPLQPRCDNPWGGIVVAVSV